MNRADDLRHVIPALLVLVSLSVLAGQLALNTLEAYGALIMILAATALTYHGARAVTARRESRATARAIRPGK